MYLDSTIEIVPLLCFLAPFTQFLRKLGPHFLKNIFLTASGPQYRLVFELEVHSRQSLTQSSTSTGRVFFSYLRPRLAASSRLPKYSLGSETRFWFLWYLGNSRHRRTDHVVGTNYSRGPMDVGFCAYGAWVWSLHSAAAFLLKLFFSWLTSLRGTALGTTWAFSCRWFADKNTTSARFFFFDSAAVAGRAGGTGGTRERQRQGVHRAAAAHHAQHQRGHGQPALHRPRERR